MARGTGSGKCDGAHPRGGADKLAGLTIHGERIAPERALRNAKRNFRGEIELRPVICLAKSMRDNPYGTREWGVYVDGSFKATIQLDSAGHAHLNPWVGEKSVVADPDPDLHIRVEEVADTPLTSTDSRKPKMRRIGHYANQHGLRIVIWEAVRPGIECTSCQRPIAVGERFTREGVAVGGGIMAAGSGELPFCADCVKVPEPTVLVADQEVAIAELPAELHEIVQRMFKGVRRTNTLRYLSELWQIRHNENDGWISHREIVARCGLSPKTVWSIESKIGSWADDGQQLVELQTGFPLDPKRRLAEPWRSR